MPLHDAAWYDEAMASEGALAMEVLENSPWLQLYEAAAKLVTNRSAAIVDLGCGTGRFIEQLYRNHHQGHAVGVDFAPAVLDAARRYTRKRPATYELCDLRQWKAPFPLPGNTIFTCLEVLEHIEDDLDLVRRIPPGHTLVFSVPNFESASHVRWFHGAGDVWERYSPLLSMESWQILVHGDKATHVCKAFRRHDSW